MSRSNASEDHHIVPRFHLARWAAKPHEPIEVFDRRELEVRYERPKDFYKFPAFNCMTSESGSVVEREFMILESDVARYMDELQTIKAPQVHLKRCKNNNWHPGHLLNRNKTAQFARYIAAQAVRSPVWRDAVKAHTAADIKLQLETRVSERLRSATDPDEIARLTSRLQLKYKVTEIGGAFQLPHISLHLAGRLGGILYADYLWSIISFPAPCICLGDDPVLFFNISAPHRCGSYSQVATAAGATFSVYRADVEQLSDAAAEVMAYNDLIVLPIDPRTVLLLTKLEHLRIPGRYEGTEREARFYNSLLCTASQRWLVIPPGGMCRMRQRIYEQYPWKRRDDGG
jgi:hypothetical protein